MRHRLAAPFVLLAVLALALGVGMTVVSATEPCGDFGECKALIEINASDGDIGFHFLMDGDDLNSARIFGPEGEMIFQDQAKGPLRQQKLTETFAESAEPLCWPDGESASAASPRRSRPAAPGRRRSSSEGPRDVRTRRSRENRSRAWRPPAAS